MGGEESSRRGTYRRDLSEDCLRKVHQGCWSCQSLEVSVGIDVCWKDLLEGRLLKSVLVG